VLAVGDGTIVAAEDMFFERNAVFLNHGDGLISIYFHLSRIEAMVGQVVKKG
jgi:murein DD-endopeptidase MepM/ murein hydrolase activator NlpD